MTHYSENLGKTLPAKESAALNRRGFFQFSLQKIMGVTLASAFLTKAVMNWQEPEKKRIQSMWLGMRDRQISEARMQFEHALLAEHPHEALRSLHIIMQGRPSLNDAQESPISLDDIRASRKDIEKILTRECHDLRHRSRGETDVDAQQKINECKDVAEIFHVNLP